MKFLHSSASLATAAFLLLCAGAAQAHEGAGAVGGFVSGFLHPLMGWDHVIAMVAVGLWGAFLGAPALWVLPVVFPLVMTVGGALGVLGIPIPAVEIGIAVSAVVLGGVVAGALKPPMWIAAVIVGAFAIFHGHAHGTELPQAADPVAYSLGFVVATGLLHLAGIAFGLLTRWPLGIQAVRAAGAAIAVGGLGSCSTHGEGGPSRRRAAGCHRGTEAWAHGAIKGLGDFGGGFFHPLVEPVHLIALISLALMCGQRGVVASQRALLALSAGVAVGLLAAAGGHATDAEVPLLVAALLVGLGVMAERPWPIALASGLAGAIGLGIGLGTAPEGLKDTAFAASLAGTWLGASLCTLSASTFLGEARAPWMRVLIRVAGSWVSACALLVLALHASGRG